MRVLIQGPSLLMHPDAVHMDQVPYVYVYVMIRPPFTPVRPTVRTHIDQLCH